MMTECTERFEKIMTVALRDCRFYAHHGVFEQEQRCGNEFAVSMEVIYPFTREIKDSIEHTISYADLFQLIKEEMDIPSKLLESVAERIANKALQRWELISRLKIEIVKITPPIPNCTGSAAVCLEYSSSRIIQ